MDRYNQPTTLNNLVCGQFGQGLKGECALMLPFNQKSRIKNRQFK